MNRITALALCVLLSSSILNAQKNWPQFRGESGGVVTDAVLPVSWSTTENVAWSSNVPGRGWSCPVVWGDKIFLTTVASEGEVEEAKKGLYLGGNRRKPSTDVHHWIVLCYDWKTGAVLWQKTVHIGKPSQPVHVKNTYASETPVTDGERVYFYFGNLGLFCFDLDGKELWRKSFEPVKIRYNWGTAASPVLYKDKLFIVNDNEEHSYLLCLDAATGEEIFRIARDEKSNWATPFIWENSLRTELVTCGSNRVRSYDLNGNELWTLGRMSSITIPTPVAAHDMLFVTSGYVGDVKGKPIYAVRPGASGDISPQDEEHPGDFIAWFHRTGGPYNPSPIVYGDYIYVLKDRGLVSCYDARTGELIYEKQRLAKDAKAFTASPWANDGKLYCLSEDGDTFVVQAGPEFKVLARNPLGEMCMATPAAVRGCIIIRTLTRLYKIGS